ncbi:MAG: hypothetical protein J0I47_05830 [Sphingomonas sp.]|nr:hypothetical protein [Sphingomonas sp.]MBN8807739.1 hypothetical protein [Sphingomonas sp.]
MTDMTDRDQHPDSPPRDEKRDKQGSVEQALDNADNASRGEVRNQNDDAQ